MPERRPIDRIGRGHLSAAKLALHALRITHCLETKHIFIRNAASYPQSSPRRIILAVLGDHPPDLRRIAFVEHFERYVLIVLARRLGSLARRLHFRRDLGRLLVTLDLDAELIDDGLEAALSAERRPSSTRER